MSKLRLKGTQQINIAVPGVVCGARSEDSAAQGLRAASKKSLLSVVTAHIPTGIRTPSRVVEDRGSGARVL